MLTLFVLAFIINLCHWFFTYWCRCAPWWLHLQSGSSSEIRKATGSPRITSSCMSITPRWRKSIIPSNSSMTPMSITRRWRKSIIPSNSSMTPVSGHMYNPPTSIGMVIFCDVLIHCAFWFDVIPFLYFCLCLPLFEETDPKCITKLHIKDHIASVSF